MVLNVDDHLERAADAAAAYPGRPPFALRVARSGRFFLACRLDLLGLLKAIEST